MKHEIEIIRVKDEASRQQALAVMRVIYRDEKNWVRDDEKLVARQDITDPAVSWFVGLAGGEPVGVVRVLYSPPLELYRTYGFKPVNQGLDLDAFIRDSRVAEIGRFAVLPEHRRNVLVAVALMRAAAHETLARNFTHYITDVFEGERHSPYEFHRRVMGFKLVATHDTGELNCRNRRLTLVLDLADAYARLRRERGWVFRYLTEGWAPELHQQMQSIKTALANSTSALVEKQAESLETIS